MGITYITGTAEGANGKVATVRFLVDSGSGYTVLPHRVWQSLGLQPERLEAFSLADGTVVERHVSECRVVLPQGRCHTPVVLGEPGDAALLGVVTLEELGLVLNPFTRQLQRMRLLLPSIRKANDL